MFEILLLRHKVDRVLGFFSSHPNWDRRRVPPPFSSGGDTLARVIGREGPQFGRGDIHCGTLGTVYMHFVCYGHLL